MMFSCISVLGALTDDIISYYKSDTDGSYPDAHGSNDGTIYQAAYTASGKINGAYSYDGIDGTYINATGTNFNSLIWTISTWIYRDTDSGKYERIITTDDNVKYNWHIQIDSSDYIQCGFLDAIGGARSVLGSKIPTSKWMHIVFTFDGTYVRIYLDGVLNATSIDFSAYTPRTNSTQFNLGRLVDSSLYYYWFDGKVDEVGIWNRTLNSTEISELYNSDAGFQYPFAPTPPSSNFSFINEDPVNGSTIFSETLPYQLNFTFNYSSNESTTDCVLSFDYENATVNETFNVINDTLQINYTFMDELNFGLHNFTLNCTDNSFSNEETKPLYLLFDETEPAIMIYAPSTNNDTVVTSYINNLTVNVSVFDENLFNSTINIYYPNGSIYFTNSSFNTSEDWHNFSGTFNLDEEPPHEWILQVRAADGHTKQDLDFSEWDINKNDAEKMIDFGNCAVYPDEVNKIDFFDYSCSGDRCTWQYDFKDIQNVRNQFVECDSEIHIMSNEDMTWFVSGNNWIDFENVQGYDVTFTRLNDHKYKVSYHGTDISSIITNSIGELNVAEQNITFTVEHPFIAEETYDNDTVEYIPHTLTMQIINISVEVDTIDNVSIIYDGVTYEADFLGNYTYSYTATDEVLGAAENEEVEHNWEVSLTTHAPVHTHDINTTSINQTAWNYLINKSSEAEAYQTTHFLNVSVYDEITGEPINITIDMNVIFDNGYHNVSKIETYENNQTFSYYIAPDSSVKDMNISLYGSVTLSGTYNNITYVTRTLEVSQGAPIVLSNDGTTYNLNLYAIGVENSTTITFNWKTTGYVDIAGIMRVYRCNPNGTIYVVESLPITGGVATANLELLTAQYAYDVIIDGVVYQQESFFTCHVESLTIRTFFVDVSEVDLAPVIGLYLVDCVLDLVSDTTINMQWTSNPDNPATIEGCLVGYQNSISGMTEFYRNCSNLSFSLLRTIPDPGGSFYVRGLIYQEGVQGYCREDVPFNRDVNAATQFGATLLFALIFLIMGLALIYAGQTSESLLGAGIAIVVAYVLGLLALSWEWVTMAIAILVIIALLIRYGRDN